MKRVGFDLYNNYTLMHLPCFSGTILHREHHVIAKCIRIIIKKKLSFNLLLTNITFFRFRHTHIHTHLSTIIPSICHLFPI